MGVSCGELRYENHCARWPHSLSCMSSCAQMAEIAAATFERRTARAETALSKATEQWRRGSKDARDDNAALAAIIDRLEGIVLVQQVRRNLCFFML